MDRTMHDTTIEGPQKRPPWVLPALLLCLLCLSASGRATDVQPGRLLAASCANCHGTNGHSLGGMDTLAGSPQAQILGKLKAFATGERPATIMHQIARGYSDAELAEMAAYFAAQPTPPEALRHD